ncbi:MAG: NYN domain-containing protein [Actinomycetes bacterium]
MAPPRAADLEALPSDAWALVLPHLRAAMHAVPDREVDPVLTRLRAAPPVRLAGGRVRAEACALVAAGGTLWRELHARLVEADPAGLPAWLLEGGRPEPSATAPAAEHETAQLAARLEEAQQELARVRDRAAELRRERDAARRATAGAEARAASLERSAEAVHRERDEVAAELAAVRAALEAAGEERERAVERERRRQDATVASLREELRAARRAAQEAEQRAATAEGRASALADAAAAAPALGAAGRRTAAGASSDDELRPGRPSRLPAGVHPDTREAAELLLQPGRRVLVDGYNVTLTATERRGGGWSLAEQRAWLVGGLATLAARRRVEPEVFFDTSTAGPVQGERLRGVTVRFTVPGVTADDEIVLAVAASDPTEPLLVVTDDRELRGRLREHGVDLLHGGALVPLLG